MVIGKPGFGRARSHERYRDRRAGRGRHLRRGRHRYGPGIVLCGVSRVLGEPMPVTAAHLAACRMRSEAAITGPLYVCLCPTASPISPNPPV